MHSKIKTRDLGDKKLLLKLTYKSIQKNMKLIEIKKDLASKYLIFIFSTLFMSVFLYYDTKHSFIINNLIIKPIFVYVLFLIIFLIFVLISDVNYSFDFELYEDKILSINSITKDKLEYKFIEIDKIEFKNDKPLLMKIYFKDETSKSFNFDFYSDEKNEFLKKLKELDVNVEIMI